MSSHIVAIVQPYQNKDKKEVDLLINANRMLYPIENIKSTSPGKDAIKHFGVLEPVLEPEQYSGLASMKVGIGTGSVVCMASDLMLIDANNWHVSIRMI